MLYTLLQALLVAVIVPPVETRKDEVGMDGWVNKTLDTSLTQEAAVCFLFPSASQRCFNKHDHNRSITTCLLLLP